MADLEGTRSIDIAASPEQCFAIAADVGRAPEWHGAMKKAEVLEHDANGRPSLVQSEMDASVTKVNLRLRFSYEEPSVVRWTREDGDLKALDGSWRFAPREDGGTTATYTLEIGLGRRLAMLVKTVRGPIRDRVESLLVDGPLDGLKARAEGAD